MLKLIFTIYKRVQNLQRRFKHYPFKYLVGNHPYFTLKCWLDTLPVRHLYSRSSKNIGDKTVVLIFNGDICNVGLADRLRSTASIYHWCKLNGLKLYIFFNKPFCLSDYLIPASYNWSITEKQLDYGKAEPISLISYNWIFGEEKSIELHRWYLHKLINSKFSQIHIYTNTYCYDDYFYESFNELFKPSTQLESELDMFGAEIGTEYISISFRFTQLLGDLKDTYGQPLPEHERKRLIKKCIDAIKPILEDYDAEKCLVTSDSKIFLEEVSNLPYVYLLPGEVGHISNDVSEEQVRKTFWDMFMISRAKKAFMVRTKQMYRSGFAKRAAMIGNIPFEEIILM